MARAYGWNARLLLGFENSYGVAPDTYYQVPFISSSLDSEQGLISSNILGTGRDPTAPFLDVIKVEGDLVIPVDLRNLGFWLAATFGQVTSSDSGPYQHQFVSGLTELPSLSLELGLPQVPDYPLFSGVRCNSLAFNFERSGEAQVTVNLLGQGELAAIASRSSKPTSLPYTGLSQFQGSIKQGDELLANVTSAAVTYSNNLEAIATIRNDGKVDAIDPGMTSLTGTIVVRYSDSTWLAPAHRGQPINLELAYTLDSQRKLQILLHEVYLPKPKRTINGPGGVEMTYEFQGASNPNLGKMTTVILTNDMENYPHA